MNIDKIEKLITKYGSELTSKLQIASGQVYEKVLWYVKINGIVNLFTLVLFITLIIAVLKLAAIAHKRFKIDEFSQYDDTTTIFYLASFLIGIIIVLAGTTVIPQILIKLFVPEYWIIDQIIIKATN